MQHPVSMQRISRALLSINFFASNTTDVAYQNNMSRLKYGDPYKDDIAIN